MSDEAQLRKDREIEEALKEFEIEEAARELAQSEHDRYFNELLDKHNA